MAKYDPLRSELRQRASGQLTMRFDEIADVLEFPEPKPRGVRGLVGEPVWSAD